MKKLGLFGMVLAVAFAGGVAARHLWIQTSQHSVATFVATPDTSNTPDQPGLSERQKMARMIARIAARSAAQTTRSMIANRNGNFDLARNGAAPDTSKAAAETP